MPWAQHQWWLRWSSSSFYSDDIDDDDVDDDLQDVDVDDDLQDVDVDDDLHDVDINDDDVDDDLEVQHLQLLVQDNFCDLNEWCIKMQREHDEPKSNRSFPGYVFQWLISNWGEEWRYFCVKNDRTIIVLQKVVRFPSLTWSKRWNDKRCENLYLCTCVFVFVSLNLCICVFVFVLLRLIHAMQVIKGVGILGLGQHWHFPDDYTPH